MRKRVELVVNPYSTGVTGDRVSAVEGALCEHVDVSTSFTEHRGHATDLVQATDADAIVVFSGDGTYNEALNGTTSLPFGFLPGGGTSVFARAIGLPRDPVEAARAVGLALVEGRSRRISLGRVNGRRFCFSAGIGFDAEAVRRLDKLGRKPSGERPGDVQFAWTFARMLLERRGAWPPQIDSDLLGRVAFVMVANGNPYSYAGSFPLRLMPDAEFELGFDVLAPSRVRRRDIPSFISYVARGKGKVLDRGVQILHDLDRLEVRCDRPLPLQVDGEDLGDVDAAVFEAERDAVSVLV
ncbi:MAG TPA: diacylglycerol kinase family protein [Gaiellaceae bacterium]|nr:diacylglycerol kinase family protein [Gaiellaceae bacterium]